MNEAFALWITGQPSSGKTTIAHALLGKLEADAHIHAAHLESKELQKLMTAEPKSSEQEWFQRVFLYTGRLLIAHGVPVIFDATANRGTYREAARASIPRFLEIRAQNHESQETAPDTGEKSGADIVIDTSELSVDAAVNLIEDELRRRHWV
ncbi:MAG TPA: AAA family ATPase [Acidobacteriota bacterium]|nr:AAA family ATPase [Acidobacteriota bacterium]